MLCRAVDGAGNALPEINRISLRKDLRCIRHKIDRKIIADRAVRRSGKRPLDQQGINARGTQIGRKRTAEILGGGDDLTKRIHQLPGGAATGDAARIEGVLITRIGIELVEIGGIAHAERILNWLAGTYRGCHSKIQQVEAVAAGNESGDRQRIRACSQRRYAAVVRTIGIGKVSSRRNDSGRAA